MKIRDRIEIYSPGEFPANHTPASFVTGNKRPIRRNPLITRTLYYSQDMESFASGLKRIQRFCDEAGCKVEFQTIEAGFVVCFYRKNATDFQSKPRKTQEKAQEKTQEITLPISDIILDFCKTPKSKAEIMEYCGYKSKKRFTANYLKPLLDTGKLVMTNPENPKNRNQKYITV